MSDKEKKADKAAKESKKSVINWDEVGAGVKDIDKKIKGFDYKGFLMFEKLVAPALIKLAFWIGIIVITVGAVFSMVSAGSLGGFIGAFIGWPVSIILLRLVCEMWLVLFGMYDRLGDIRKELSRK